ncbi:type II toxin-antitoxin system RelE/ParE family toxin [uncultured Sphingomonas sp.]|uniref:type II toxin-antitoxin system RelE/ParE family toxin n=1 Tax=uncultured Sphingomonas sp. TaxID=158754 RepID=UPI0025F6E42E|nr:type II toxin-antitoxin system RelE/ParE family toxin [uncultured Sphingomonas sp.]
MRPIRYASLARRDVQSIHQYHAVDPALAKVWAERIVAAGLVPEDIPYADPEIASGRRKWRVHKTRYVLHYRVTAAEVRILRVLHASRNQAGA